MFLPYCNKSKHCVSTRSSDPLPLSRQQSEALRHHEEGGASPRDEPISADRNYAVANRTTRKLPERRRKVITVECISKAMIVSIQCVMCTSDEKKRVKSYDSSSSSRTDSFGSQTAL
ncbi:uncharacterized [Tachysurus ichikawai]